MLVFKTLRSKKNKIFLKQKGIAPGPVEDVMNLNGRGRRFRWPCFVNRISV